ncbi:MAA3 [Symbiodinium natans]|uniref:MAA3 protein n=1 Tax=Symbiodinium natans TaxID=878477 RepID=A0A812SYF0_9DINO|nr:MAA3 [Symbiodinium natans]
MNVGPVHDRVLGRLGVHSNSWRRRRHQQKHWTPIRPKPGLPCLPCFPCLASASLSASGTLVALVASQARGARGARKRLRRLRPRSRAPSQSQGQGQCQPLADFPLDGVTLTDYMIQHTDIMSCSIPYDLPEAPVSFDSVAHFVDVQLAAVIEMLREDLGYMLDMCKEAPPGQGPGQHAHLQYLGTSLSCCNIAADGGKGIAAMKVMPLPQRFPLENSRSQWSRFMLLAQCRAVQKSKRVKDVGLVFCETMNQKDGLVLWAPERVLKKLQSCMLQGDSTCFWKLQSFNRMVTDPLAVLQNLRSAPPTEMCRALFFGEISGGSESDADLCQRLDCWVAANPHVPMMFNRQQGRALALEALTAAGPVVVQGPPGTGKSHLIAHALLPQIIQRGGRALVLCNSNSALDSIAEKVLDPGEFISNSGYVSAESRCLRVGFQKKVCKKVLEAGWFREFNAIHEVSSGRKSVVFTTLYNTLTKHEDFSKAKFDTLIIDEAGQVEDWRLFIVLQTMTSLKKVILVGDHKQLQPYVSDGVRDRGYGRSTMERLIAGKVGAGNAGIDFIMLEEQHRMPPSVRNIVSRVFYNNRLTDGPNILAKSRRSHGTSAKAIVAFDLSFGKTNLKPLERSLENLDEATISKLIYDHLLQAPSLYTVHDICVLSPYNRHKNRLRTMLAGIPEGDWARWENLSPDVVMDSSMDDQTAAVRNIDTVDKFQGSEREVVIINTVSGCLENTQRACDPHFINVAMSRCKSLLVLIGRLTELGDGGGSWQRIMTFLQEAQVQAHGGGAEDVLILPCGTMEEAKAGVEALLHFVLPPGSMTGSMTASGPDAKRSKA